MWQRFTERARAAVYSSQEEARRLGHAEVSTEHLLLGILKDEVCVAAHVLTRMGIDTTQMRTELDRVSLRGRGGMGRDMQLTPQAKRVIDLAYAEARRISNNYIGTEHLLLALIRGKDGVAGQVLEKMGVGLDRARAEVLALQENSGRGTVGEPGRFTQRARNVIFYAQEEAGLLGQTEISTEHLLLGLIRDDDDAKYSRCNVATHLLIRMGVTVSDIRTAVDWRAACDTKTMGTEIVLTKSAQWVRDLAAEEAGLLHHDYVGTEHLLLGLIQDRQGLAGQVLANIGVDLTRTRQEIQNLTESE